mmetsp:Transcript_13147/g.23640  ORF Transcript_13147/g.23640 Transcript_13147/m.23640 type:complete len:268 (+) Transcript_13147:134-937(+)
MIELSNLHQALFIGSPILGRDARRRHSETRNRCERVPIFHSSTRVAQNFRTRMSSKSTEVGGQMSESTDQYKLACWLAADWSNKEQAIENPPFWSHIRVCFRPLPASFFPDSALSFAFYTESAYDYNLSQPYKSSVIRISLTPGGDKMELVSYKITKDPEEFFYGSRDPTLLESLDADRLLALPCGCNTVYEWDTRSKMYRGYTRPGKQCRMPKGGYLSSEITLREGHYTSWDLGKDEETDETVWGAGAGPFDFYPDESFAHEVPIL